MDYFLELVDEADKDKNGKIDMSEWEFMGKLCYILMPFFFSDPKW